MPPGPQAVLQLSLNQVLPGNGVWGAARPEAPEIRDRIATTVDARATAVSRDQPPLVQPAISPSFKAVSAGDGEQITGR